jgi:hypothetical protein
LQGGGPQFVVQGGGPQFFLHGGGPQLLVQGGGPQLLVHGGGPQLVWQGGGWDGRQCGLPTCCPLPHTGPVDPDDGQPPPFGLLALQPVG